MTSTETMIETEETCASNKVVCEHCGLEFLDHYVLQKHIYHEHVNEHVCDTCQTSFKTKRDLTHHQKFVHKERKPFICQICSSAHPFEYKLTQHIKTVHEKIKPYKCNTCPWVFRRSWELSNHKLYVHDKYKPFECPYCQRRIGRKEEYTNHIKVVHDQVKAFSCDKCDKWFGMKFNLRKHQQLMHEITIPEFPCEECGKLFRTKSKARDHFKLVHARIRNFKCEFCQLMFETGSKCRRHMLIHIKQGMVSEDEARAMFERHKKETRVMYHRSMALTVKEEHKTNKDETSFEMETGQREPLQKETFLGSSLDPILESPLSHDAQMNLLGDVVNDFNMTDELGDTLEHIKKIIYPKQQTQIKTELLDHPSDYMKHLEMLNNSGRNASQSKFEDSGFEGFNKTIDTSLTKNDTKNLTTVKPQFKKSSHSRISATNSILTESRSNILEIYSSSSSKEPITSQDWVQVEKFLICQLTTEITTGVISAMQVKISNSGYNESKKMGFIHVMDGESKDWYQCKIAKCAIDGKCFRAWSENEELEVYQLRLILPSKLDSISDTLVIKLLDSFNPTMNIPLMKFNLFEVIENKGRKVHVEVSKETFELIKENEWKLDFVMGKVDCIK